MSYETERKVLTNHLHAQSFFDLAPFGLDGDDITIQAGGGFMAILNGQAAQASTGAPNNNLHDYPGVLSITVVTASGDGSSEGRTKADTIINALTGLKLDETGAAPSASSTMVIDFARNGLAPYIASARPEGKFHRTVVNAPFIRTERK